MPPQIKFELGKLVPLQLYNSTYSFENDLIEITSFDNNADKLTITLIETT